MLVYKLEYSCFQGEFVSSTTFSRLPTFFHENQDAAREKVLCFGKSADVL